MATFFFVVHLFINNFFLTLQKSKQNSMNDYLRTRIDALTREVSRLERKVEYLEAVLEVEHNNNYKHKTEC